jgi:hypothetical protein
VNETEYIIGVDLGQAHDFTALAVLQRGTRITARTEVGAEGYPVWAQRHRNEQESTYQVRHLERLPRSTPYPAQVERVSRLVADVRRVAGVSPRLVVDQTGVGRPVVDMLRDAGHRTLNAVTIHGGDQATREGSAHRVPKRELVSILQVLLQAGRLQVAASLLEAETLTKEMLAFKVTLTASGHDQYGNDWRENPHDDLVLAVALGCWLGEHARMTSLKVLRVAAGIG